MQMTRTLIGKWHEDSREFTYGHTYYAADWIKIRTTPGEYDAYLLWDLRGYTIPMPQYLHVAVSAEVRDGRLHSGIGGVNYVSTPIEPGPYIYGVQPYSYHIPKLVEEGKLTLSEEWTWLSAEEYIPFIKENWTRQMVVDRAV